MSVYAEVAPVDEYLTVKEAAQYLKVHPETIRRHLQAGDLKGSRATRSWRVRKSELDRWLEDHMLKF